MAGDAATTFDRATILTIAGRAGRDPRTVAKAFARPEGVRPLARDAIFRAARELGFQPEAQTRCGDEPK